MKTPILFIIFNRPDTTRLVFETIRQARPAQLFVAGDGPRDNRPDDTALCQQARDIIRSVNWSCEVKTLFHETNLGCRKAVSSAIDWYFSNVEEGIILEDDCLPDPTFFPFCEALLEYYRHDSRIMQINGCNFQSGQQRGNCSYYFSKYNHVWGWASWKRAWKMYDVNIPTFPEFRASERIKEIFSDSAYQNYWLNAFEAVYSQKKDTWDYQWTYAIWANNGLCVLPNVNLISNIGFSDGATHTAKNDPMYTNLPTKPIRQIVHPNEVVRDVVADDYSTRTLFVRSIGKRQRLIRFFKRFF